MNDSLILMLGVVSSAIVALSFGLLWWLNRRQRFIAFWALHAVTVWLAVVSGVLHDRSGNLAAGLASALLISISAAALWAGTRCYVDRPVTSRRVASVAIVLFGMTAVIAFLFSSQLGRFAGSWPLALACIWSGIEVQRRGADWVERFLGYLLLGRGAAIFARPFIESMPWLPVLSFAIAVALALSMLLAALTKNQRQLEKTRLGWSDTLDLIPDPVIITRAECGTILRVNRAWENLFGYSREEVTGQTTESFGFWKSGDIRAQMRSLVAGTPSSIRFDADHVKKNGEIVKCAGTAGKIEFEESQAFIYVIRDVTEIRRISRELSELNLALEARVTERTEALEKALAELRLTQRELVEAGKVAGLGAIVAGVSHELNTPIGNARMATSTMAEAAEAFEQRLQEGGLKASELRQFVANQKNGVAMIDRSLARASTLIESFKNVTADQTSAERRVFLVDAVMHDVIQTIMPIVRQAPCEVVLETDIDPELRIDSVPGALGQVVSNLISNSALHAFEGRSKGRILLEAHVTESDEVELSVEDDGNGMPPQFIEHAFEPFHTSKLGRGGSGLGLHRSYLTVTGTLGGKIRIRSDAATGTRITLSLGPPATRASHRL